MEKVFNILSFHPSDLFSFLFFFFLFHSLPCYVAGERKKKKKRMMEGKRKWKKRRQDNDHWAQVDMILTDRIHVHLAPYFLVFYLPMKERYQSVVSRKEIFRRENEEYNREKELGRRRGWESLSVHRNHRLFLDIKLGHADFYNPFHTLWDSSALMDVSWIRLFRFLSHRTLNAMLQCLDRLP